MSSQYQAYQAWGPNVKNIWTSGVKSDTQQKMMPVGGMVVRPRFSDIGGIDTRMDSMGLRVVLPVEASKCELLALLAGMLAFDFATKGPSVPQVPVSMTQAPEEEYLLRRILYGIPEGMNDFFQGLSLPLESNLDYMQGGMCWNSGHIMEHGQLRRLLR